MAEALLGHSLRQLGPNLSVVASAGTEGGSSPATDKAVDVLAARGIDLGEHRSRALTAELVADAELIVAMTRRHEAAVTAMVPEARSRTFLAGEVARLGAGVGPVGEGGMAAADEVSDPYGDSLESYRRCADRLDGICATIARLLVPKH